MFVTHECVAGMLTYSAGELYQLRRNDVTVTRSIRKSIFSFRLWCPCRTRERCHELLQMSTQCIWSPSIMPLCSVTDRSIAVFMFLNVRSLLNKYDDVIEIIRDRRIDICYLAETWHDADSVRMGRPRCAGFNVVDRPRPRTVDDLSVNHGGVAIISTADYVLSPIAVGQPFTFELVCVRVVSGPVAFVVVALYRPGSVAVQPKFFDELCQFVTKSPRTRCRSISPATSTYGWTAPTIRTPLSFVCWSTAKG